MVVSCVKENKYFFVEEHLQDRLCSVLVGVLRVWMQLLSIKLYFNNHLP